MWPVMSEIMVGQDQYLFIVFVMYVVYTLDGCPASCATRRVSH